MTFTFIKVNLSKTSLRLFNYDIFQHCWIEQKLHEMSVKVALALNVKLIFTKNPLTYPLEYFKYKLNISLMYIPPGFYP